MKHLLLLLCFFTPFWTDAQAPEENYPVDPASEEHPGVPKGEVLKFVFDQSKIFPGTWREYWVYVPAQYKADTPACVYVNQDGIQWKAPVVFDNLIHQKEMPVTIGVFVMHGRVKAADPNAANDRFNRSFEYDGLGDAYARFILEEILPEVEKQKTSDGRQIRLSKNGNDRAIGGSSSGAVCAFTAAWERPDAFSRVFSAIGTYVGLRGADRYPTLLRKVEPKPIRIYMQDGANDLNIYAGDWWMANQTMLRALTFAGYEVKHQWGEGGHNGKQGTSLFPEAMRYLWNGWPEPVKKGQSQNAFLSALLIPGEDWAEAADAFPMKGKPEPSSANSLKTLKAGAAALSPDQTLVYTVDSTSHWVYSYQVQPNRKLAYRQRFGWLHVSDAENKAGASGIVCDRDGRIYVATNSGVQILDQTGRANAILPTPHGTASKITFGGGNSDVLYVKIMGKTYGRKLKTRGINPGEAPNKPDAPKL
ncbi:enterochelin esterase-like enzyme [Dyadobacter sp. BE34]|uniref:Enterochelin esterase-like enzyme n=1 Tax=Dyadobacter fermentans TaxID=94254 RepID=A0ABU1R6N9_9BACT|nr:MULTISPECIES: SMP-30/gluconolactonase/LRE family protein [Dyadobacter]MDR6809070.1 enterochelin esterase-like enzyme [Dyadobacter fermentans]MDR7046813.1 enterochelin esterase-like enzyme [Dyadobacter sp. BE242]MDR7201127.1 enterochelin esterase-like enzyme [Dyadobacter sp. BE34]MDR7219087.1 enterochelin esterase-like enzyme [Dyadobacter sp. BE31]MDR7264703.1 enterochelin esterase-like enzyme [Dyadobacter sp. BE32]